MILGCGLWCWDKENVVDYWFIANKMFWQVEDLQEYR